MDRDALIFWLIFFLILILLGFYSQFFYGPDNEIEQSVEKLIQHTVDIDIDFSPDY